MNFKNHEPLMKPDRYELGLVSCDDSVCQAKLEPKTFEEYVLAYKHWRYHDYMAGCAHAY
jgi:hypothetical protein